MSESPDRPVVIVPVDVLHDALAKAWVEYRRGLSGPADTDECWAEFERLAEYLPDDLRHGLWLRGSPMDQTQARRRR